MKLMDNIAIIRQVVDKYTSGQFRWTSKAFARNLAGDKCKTTDPDAVSFCAFSAIRKVIEECGGHDDHVLEVNEFWRAFDSNRSIIGFNDEDGRVLDEVLKKFRKFIQFLEQRTDGKESNKK